MKSSPKVAALAALLLLWQFPQFATAAPLMVASDVANITIRQVSVDSISGNVCIVGDSYDGETLKSVGTVIVASLSKNSKLWQKNTDAPSGFVSNRLVACRTSGDFTYAAANVDSDRSPELNQMLAFINKFDSTGKLVATVQIANKAKNASLYDIDVRAGGIEAIGSFETTEKDVQRYSVFFANMGNDLKNVSVHQLDSGAFAPFSKGKLTANAAILAGNFLPAVYSKKELAQDYAISKIINGKKYQWSVRPDHTEGTVEAASISDDGKVIVLATDAKNTYITNVDSVGKLKKMAAVSSFCKTFSLSESNEQIYTIRKKCSFSDKSNYLVRTNKNQGAEQLIEMSNEPLFLFEHDSQVYLLSRTTKNEIVLAKVAEYGGAK